MHAKNEVYSIEWCKSKSQLADYFLTKGTASKIEFLNVLKEWIIG